MLAITIYHYCSFDLTVTIAEFVQNFLETARNENNNLLKREGFKKNFHKIYHRILSSYIITIFCFVLFCFVGFFAESGIVNVCQC